MEFISISTTNKRLTVTLGKTNVELKEMDKIKNDFLANTSHELRTPINGIMGLAEAIIDGADGPINTGIKKHLNMITKSGNNLKNLINDILDLSKIQSGKQSYNIQKTTLNEIIEEIKPVVEGLVIDKDLKIKYIIDKNLNSLHVDKDKIYQVFINLIGNAVKFTEKGNVTIKVQNSKTDKDYIIASVRDTGIGIKQEFLEVIFDEFRQADGSATRNYEGTGLGLAISKKIINAHGCRIWVESQMGKGSIFYFTMPVKKFDQSLIKPENEKYSESEINKKERIKERREQDEDFDPSIRGFTKDDSDQQKLIKNLPAGKGENILVVDDIEINLEALAINLKKKGYNVSKAISAEKALALLNTGEYDLVISDVMMADMDGYELVKKIRKDNKNSRIPIILLTAKTRLEDKAKGFLVGADDYIVKPFDIGELLLRIRKIVDTRILDKVIVKTDNKEYEIQKETRFGDLNKGKGELILVIDDNKVNLEVVKTRLEMNNWKIEVANNGEDGLAKCRKLNPDLILLDIMMPGMDGYEVCRQIRHDFDKDVVPIIFLTAKQEKGDKIYGINVGGDDFITKPFDKDELVIRVANLLKRRQMLKELREKAVIDRDIILAKSIQKMLIPAVFPDNDNLEIYGGSQAARGVGGDYFDVIEMGDGKCLSVIADVMGKGISAALVMVKIQTLLRGLCERSSIDLKEVIEKINKNIFIDLKGGRFVTMFLMMYDPSNREIEYINAGHDHVVLCLNAEGKIKDLSNVLLPLGIKESYKGIKINKEKLKKGDAIVMYTDGINEAMNKEHQQFGEDRVHELVLKNYKMGVMSIYKTIIDEVADFTKGIHQTDDITLLIEKVK